MAAVPVQAFVHAPSGVAAQLVLHGSRMYHSYYNDADNDPYGGQYAIIVADFMVPVVPAAGALGRSARARCPGLCFSPTARNAGECLPSVVQTSTQHHGNLCAQDHPVPPVRPVHRSPGLTGRVVRHGVRLQGGGRRGSPS
jgi:hypothetical protein